MTRLSLLLAMGALLACASLRAQPSSFQKIYGEAGSTIGNAVLMLPDSGYLVAGAVAGPVPGSNASPALYRLAPDGAVAWRKSYPTAEDGVLRFLIPANDGGYLGTGFYRQGGLIERLMLLKTDADGNLQWAKRFQMQGLGEHVIALPDGYLIAGFQYNDPIGVIDGFLLKVDNSGEVIWSRSYGMPDKVFSFTNFVLNNDTLFATGSYENNPAFSAISLTSGLVYFSKYYSRPDQYGVSPKDLAPAADGNFIFSGQSAAILSSNYTPVNTFIKTNRNGVPLNSIMVYDNELVSFNHMEPGADGRLVLCGQVYSGDNQFQSVLVRTDDSFSAAEVFQYSNNVNLSTFYSCLPLPDGSMLGIGDFIPLLNVQDTTVVSYLQVTKTRPDGLVDGCCIQQRKLKTAAYPLSTTDLDLMVTEEIFPNPVNMNLFTAAENLALADYCPHAAVLRSDTLRFCPGDVLFLSGQLYDTPATVVDTIYSSACDTVLTTVLEWLPVPVSNQTISFCPGDAIVFNGVAYTQPATVTDTLYSLSACDTIRTTTLEWAPLPTRTQTLEFCPGDYIVFNGIAYSQPAEIVDTLSALTGCDTILTTLLVYSDLSAPSVLSLQCPADQTVTIPFGASSIPVNYTFPVLVNNCPCDAGTLSLSDGLFSGDAFPTGTTQVCYQASDACGNNTSCCFTVNVEPSADQPACDTKTTPCIRFELLGISRNNAGQKKYRMRITNTCSSALDYIAFQLPNGLNADYPFNTSAYTSPEGHMYTVRNPNAAPFHSIRFKPASSGIASGASDVFEYTLPQQADPDYIRAFARLDNGAGYETHLNVFGCTVTPETFRPAENTDRNAAGTPAGTLHIYPNPAADACFIHLPAMDGHSARLEIRDAPGRLVLETNLTDVVTPFALNIANLQYKGVFLVYVIAESGERWTGRIVCEK